MGKPVEVAPSNSEQPGTDEPGFWRPVREVNPGSGLSAEQQAEIGELEDLGYLGGSQAAKGTGGVTRHDPALAYEGINLYISGHAPEAILMDMKGQALHTWSKNFEDVWPDYELTKNDTIHDREFFSRMHLFPNGDLIAIFEGYGIFKLDKDSNLLWANPNRAHHDLFVEADGTIYVLTRRGTIIPRILPGAILEDFVTVLDSDGKQLRSVSLLEAYEKSPFAPVLNTAQPGGDLFHTNTVQVLDGRFADRSPAFRKGNVLFSCREISTIGVLDMETEKVVWSLSGPWHRQHQPDFIESGDMIIFDNLGSALPHLHPNGRSKIIEFDPLTQEIKWTYEGTEDDPFQSDTCGTAQRLPNGNTLIAETESGRAFEVTRDKDIVWEYMNPARAGENNEFIAAMFDMVRFDPDFPLDWIDGRNP